jgi:hypothetical protein
LVEESEENTVWKRRPSWDEMADGRIWFGSIWLRIRKSCSFYEKVNEIPRSIKCRYEYFVQYLKHLFASHKGPMKLVIIHD